MPIHTSDIEEYHQCQRFEATPSSASLIATRDQGDPMPHHTTEWVYRHAGGCLIETPDLNPHTTGPTRRAWLATHWREPGTSHWATLAWTPGERGWQLPHTLAVGDVIEFGTDTLDPAGWPIPGTVSRWYGWLHHATERAIVVNGPHDGALAAETNARPLVDEIRLAQLAAIDSEWPCPSGDDKAGSAND